MSKTMIECDHPSVPLTQKQLQTLAEKAIFTALHGKNPNPYTAAPTKMYGFKLYKTQWWCRRDWQPDGSSTVYIRHD